MSAIKDLGEAFTQITGVRSCGYGVCSAELIDQMPIAVYALDVEGRVSYFNPAAVQLAGREPRIGLDTWCVSWKLYRPDGSLLPHDQCAMAVALKELRDIRGAEVIVERPDGSRVWVEPYPTVLYDDDGQVRGAINIVVDITERKRAAEALAEADRRKNEFLAQLAHELRNPLTPIRNAVTILLHPDEKNAPDRRRALLSMADRQLDHLTQLVDDLLEISRINFGKMELKKQCVDLAEVLRDAIETTQPNIDQRGQTLNIELPSQPVQLDADPVRLAQVFSNLLSNAAKFTQKGDVIQLTGGSREDNAIVAVRDTGVGISAEMLPRVFDMFAQEKSSSARLRGGLGIGLALVKNIVELHGGRVEAHSDGVGHGSEFIVYLPTVAQRKSGQPTGDRTSIQQGTTPRVLVIDDDHDVADSLAMLLETIGAEVRVAYAGTEGIQMLTESIPAFVFLDIGMAEMDGYETARRIRGLPGTRDGMQLVALTGWGQEADRDRAREAGFDRHITKPASIEELEALLAMNSGIRDGMV